MEREEVWNVKVGGALRFRAGQIPEMFTHEVDAPFNWEQIWRDRRDEINSDSLESIPYSGLVAQSVVVVPTRLSAVS